MVAFGTLYEEDGSVEVQAGSEIVKYNKGQEYEEWQYDRYEELLEEGIIKETENGAVFVKDFMFIPHKKNNTALSETAGIILCGNRNGWEYWKDVNRKSLNSNKELKKRLSSDKYPNEN